MSFSRRLLWAFWALALGISALFSLFAMAFAYTVEDQFLERQLAQEAARLQAGRAAAGGAWPAPSAPQYRVVLNPDALPDGLAQVLAAEPRRREFSGPDGRHYHLQPLDGAWLVAEVSDWLVVRPDRGGLLRWLAGWTLGATLLALGVGAALARRLARPLARLSDQVSQARPGRLPQGLAAGLPTDEVGQLARALDGLNARTQAFIEREQAFTRDASHELRTPLAVLKLALSAPAMDAAQLRRMRRAVQQLEDCLEGLLWLAREPDDRAAEPTDTTRTASTALLPLVERWVLDHEDALQGRPLRVQLHADDRLALPEPALRIVLSNLLGNALAHGQGQGQGEIVLQREPDGALCVANPSSAPPEGVGQPYVKGAGSAGFGLGLSLVERVLARHGSRWALDHAQGWTRVRVWA